MKHIVVGTAGHIDHGKTTLVRALTGVDTDRLEEEKRRGISIDLGFASLRLGDSLQAAFIDVPGHERFIRNMLAGVGGIDLVMLVVSAEESVRPQTREHFEICRLLRISSGFVALTRVDLVDPDLVELVRMEVEEFVAGSFLEGAPIIPVSPVTGLGLDDVRATLRNLADKTPVRSSIRNFRMPVDRSFVMQGFGTVVTGTVTAGSVDAETDVEILPSGLRARVRGLQVHGRKTKATVAGQRAAVNLSGIEATEIGRGQNLVRPGSFRSTRVAECILEVLSSAHPVKDGAPVHFHSGTQDVIAKVRTLDRSAALEPGSSAPVRLTFQDAVLLAPGDRFIVRMFSPVTTIGGGEVVDPFPPAKLKRADALKRVLALRDAGTSQRIAFLVREQRGGLSLSELIVRTGLTARAIEAAVPPGIVRTGEGGQWMLDQDWVKETAEHWRELVAGFHRAHPLLPGIGREELRSRELPDLPPFVFNAVLAQSKALVSTGEFVHLATHKLALREDEERALQAIERAFETAGLKVPGADEVLQSSGVDPARARSLLQVLLRQKRLIRVNEDLLFHPTAIAALRELLAARKGVRFSVGDFKDWTGVSRKYAIPLLEYLDRERMCRREGDSRVVL